MANNRPWFGTPEKKAEPQPQDKLPEPRQYEPRRCDLEELNRYSDWGFEGPYLVAVYHRDCGGEIVADPDPYDPVMSRYYCDSFGVCSSEWKQYELDAMPESALAQHFYTKLADDQIDKERLHKLVEVVDGKVRYTTTRPTTDAEIEASRDLLIKNIRKQIRERAK